MTPGVDRWLREVVVGRRGLYHVNCGRLITIDSPISHPYIPDNKPRFFLPNGFTSQHSVALGESHNENSAPASLHCQLCVRAHNCRPWPSLGTGKGHLDDRSL